MTSIRSPLARVLPCAFALTLQTAAVAGDEDDQKTSEHNYLLGAMALSQPEYERSDRRVIKVRPLWAYQWGRFMLSTSRSASAMNFASDPQEGVPGYRPKSRISRFDLMI